MPDDSPLANAAATVAAIDKPTRRRERRGGTYVLRRPAKVPGESPGTLHVDPEAPPSVVRVIAWDGEHHVDQPVTDLDALVDMRQRWPVMWVNCDGLGDERVLRRLGEIFNLHPLALEDVVNVTQRPKAEPYDDHEYVVLRMIRADGAPDSEQFSLFFGERFVLTFQEAPGDCLDAVRERIKQQRGRMKRATPDYIAYALIDALVDSIFPALESYGDELAQLEDAIFESAGKFSITRLFRIKHDLLTLRRLTWPLRDLVAALQREDHELITDHTRLYLRDAHDHAVQIAELIEAYREIAASLVDLYLSTNSNRMNLTMRLLAVISTIFIPLTFVAGVYGMNFNPGASPWSMPELNWEWGYVVTLSVMFAIAVSLLVYFWRKGWLRASELGDRRRRDAAE